MSVPLAVQLRSPAALIRAVTVPLVGVHQEDALRQAAELAAAKQNPVKLEAPIIITYRLTRDIVAPHDGRIATIKKGSTVLQGDPLLHEAPDAWSPVNS